MYLNIFESTIEKKQKKKIENALKTRYWTKDIEFQYLTKGNITHENHQRGKMKGKNKSIMA